jgi:hypothetical protein
MATQVFSNCKLYVNEFNLSGSMNKLANVYTAEMLDDTTFGDDTRSNLGGLKKGVFANEGLYDAGAGLPDTIIFPLIGVQDTLQTTCFQAGAEGQVAYMCKVMAAEYTHGGAVGDIHSFSYSAESTGSLVRGQILRNATDTSSGNGTAFQTGAIGATQTMHSFLHVYSASGTSPTLDLIVQSDDNESFTSATSRITHTQATGVTSEALSLAGAVTDDWWRVNLTIGGSDTPTFGFILSVGIIST